MDQAYNLRQSVKNRKTSIDDIKNTVSSRIITVTSGKGGVGKSNFTLNMAINLSRLGYKVVIIDADFGLSNIEVLFGTVPKYNFSHLLDGSRTIQEILMDGPEGVKFISGGSGLKELVNISDRQMEIIFDKFSYIDTVADVILIDTGAGISQFIINFIRASKECILLTTPEPTSITDAYAVLKTIKDEERYSVDFKVVVNRCDDNEEGLEVFNRISRVSKKFLDIELTYLGCIWYDNLLVKSVKMQEPASILFPNSSFNKSIEDISNKLMGLNTYKNNSNQSLKNKNGDKDNMKSFMRRLTSRFSK